MSVFRKLGSSLVFVSIILASASPVFAGPAVGTTHETHTGTITWTIPAGQCAVHPAELTGTGERLEQTNTTVKADGSMNIIDDDSVKGVATDANGSYVFVYHNRTIQSIPASGAPVQVSMVDSFVLNGPGGAGSYSTGFNWSWTYDPAVNQIWPPSDNWQKTSTRGDSFTCDPI